MFFYKIFYLIILHISIIIRYFVVSNLKRTTSQNDNRSLYSVSEAESASSLLTKKSESVNQLDKNGIYFELLNSDISIEEAKRIINNIPKDNPVHIQPKKKSVSMFIYYLITICYKPITSN